MKECVMSKLYPFLSSSSAITSFSLSLQSLNGHQWSDLAFEFSKERACLLVFFLSSSANLILSLFTSEPLSPPVSISSSIPFTFSCWNFEQLLQFGIQDRFLYIYFLDHVLVGCNFWCFSCSSFDASFLAVALFLTIWECLGCLRWIVLSKFMK